jgi:collagenase-like PrtC family protease
VKLRCYLESLLKIHRPDCEQCNTPATWGPDIRQRLEELNSRTQQHSLDTGEPEEPARAFDSKPSEGIASQSISLTQQKKIV